MNELMKVRDISLKYQITTRALKYYEDMGLIQSSRTADYAYRCYDPHAVARLEQILILRKLDISIKDIVRIFASGGAEILLDVLRRKVDGIDEQIVLLDDLKRYILDFIDSAEKYDFNDQSDVKRLYEKANAMEARLSHAPAPMGKAVEIAKKLESAPVVGVVDFPAVSMACCSNDREREDFQTWWQALEREYRPLHAGNLSWFDHFTGKMVDVYALPRGFDGDCPYEVIEFPGGLYASATFLDDPYEYAFECNTGYLYKWVGESEDFQPFLAENDARARFVMWRNKPSVGRELPQVEFSVPIVRKGTPQWIHTEDIPAEDVLGTPKNCHAIDLYQLVRSGGIDVRFVEEGLKLYQQGTEGYCRTQETFRLPLRIDLTAKTDSANVRVSFAGAGLVFNWGVAPNSLITSDVLEGGHYRIDGVGYLPTNEYAQITWIIQRAYMAVIVNGQVRFVGRDYPYIHRLVDDRSLEIRDTVRVHTAFGATVTVQKLEIHELE